MAEGRRSVVEGLDIGDGAPERPGAGGARSRHAILVWSAGLMIAAALIVTVVQLIGRPSDPGDNSRRRVAADAETGEVFVDYPIRDGDSQPWKNPRTGKRSLYPAEACFWTRDGGAKLEPTYVGLNEYSGKPGPTTCPDCGRTVVAHNPLPPPELLAAAAKSAPKSAK